METRQITPQTRQRRKLLLALPLLALPFAALAFYALGGGKGTPAEETAASGINTALPGATFKKREPMGKMDFYEQARRDFIQAAKEDRNRPFGGLGISADIGGPDGQEALIAEKLVLLEEELSRPVETRPAVDTAAYRPEPILPDPMPDTRADIERLERLMEMLDEKEPASDPEMEQLNGMLERILDIQHPERVKRRLTDETDAGAAPSDSLFRAIPAVIADKQKAVDGATIRLILKDTVTLSGYRLPKGHELFGTCRIVSQRLLLDISSVRLGTSIIPVSLTVYSYDGMPGIAAKEAVLTDAVNAGTGDLLRSTDIIGYDGSLAMQAAGAGIDAAKDLVSKRLRKIKVKLRAGQAVLLRDNQRRRR